LDCIVEIYHKPIGAAAQLLRANGAASGAAAQLLMANGAAIGAAQWLRANGAAIDEANDKSMMAILIVFLNLDLLSIK
jgi:hypothetical protein